MNMMYIHVLQSLFDIDRYTFKDIDQQIDQRTGRQIINNTDFKDGRDKLDEIGKNGDIDTIKSIDNVDKIDNTYQTDHID